MTISDVARHLRMSWHTIKEMDRAYLGKRYGKMRLCDLRYLAIDEIAYKKGHRYKTIVYDLEGRMSYSPLVLPTVLCFKFVQAAFR
jgi:transposase